MRDYLEIGPTPADESCEQLGPHYNPVRARAECRAFINQLKRQFGAPPDGAEFTIRSSPHDFGTYLEVAVRFDDSAPEAIDFAFRVEEDSPSQWDDQARAELGLILDPRA